MIIIAAAAAAATTTTTPTITDFIYRWKPYQCSSTILPKGPLLNPQRRFTLIRG